VTSKKPSVIGICAQTSNSGKTTLICRLIPALAQLGIRVSVIKHTHHQIQIDHPGKDSFQIRQAGAVQTLVGDAKNWALISQTHINQADADELDYLLQQLDTSMCDLVLLEGFKQAPVAKIEVHRGALHQDMLASQDSSIIAVTSDSARQAPCPLLDLNDIDAIANFIFQYIRSSK
jgi:molybdopterin-guanine dinucleotide biosynthesis protein B